MLPFSNILLTPTPAQSCLLIRLESARSSGEQIVLVIILTINGFLLKSRRKLQIHMEKARDHGSLDVDCPSVDYDYKDYIQQSGK